MDAGEGPQWPLVILAFNESHILTDLLKDWGWALFSELCYALRRIVDQPIFSLFLLTVGNFHHFSSEIHLDHSRQILNQSLHPLDPITEVSFDDLARPIIENQASLAEVVTTEWISHLGMPLFILHLMYFFKSNLFLIWAGLVAIVKPCKSRIYYSL